MYLMIDNYDSFVYNLKAYLQELGRDILVRRSDELTLDDIQAMQPQGIILSPGPKRPWDAQLCVDTVRRFGGVKKKKRLRWKEYSVHGKDGEGRLDLGTEGGGAHVGVVPVVHPLLEGQNVVHGLLAVVGILE